MTSKKFLNSLLLGITNTVNLRPKPLGMNSWVLWQAADLSCCPHMWFCYTLPFWPASERKYSLSAFCMFSVPMSPCSHLAQNPFICDCHLKWLADYLQDNPIETSGARCTSPRRLANKRIGQIKSKKFRCSGIDTHTHTVAHKNIANINTICSHG